MSRGRSNRSFSGLLGQQTVASRREAREQRAELTFRKVGMVILIFIVVSVLANIWLGWAVIKDIKNLAVSREEHRQGKLFNQELVVQRKELLSSKSIERKAAVLGLFKPDKKKIRIL